MTYFRITQDIHIFIMIPYLVRVALGAIHVAEML